MKYTKGQIAIVVLGLASVAALLVFTFRSTIIASNGAFVLRPSDWQTLGLMAVWLVGGGYLLRRFRRRR
jgi:predicted RND superfamily exporter protein